MKQISKYRLAIVKFYSLSSHPNYAGVSLLTVTEFDKPLSFSWKNFFP